MFDLANPVNWAHPLADDLLTWWLAVPGIAGTAVVPDLCAMPGSLLQGNAGTWANAEPRGASTGVRGTARPGGFGQFTFDGSNDVVGKNGGARGLGTANSLLTITLWGMLRSTAGSYVGVMVSDANGSASNAVTLSYAPSTLRCTKAGGTMLADSGILPVVGSWFHMAMTWDGTTTRIYINGQLKGSTTTAHDTGALSFLWMGNYGSAVAQDWDGALDDLRIYTRCKSSRWVWDLYLNSAQGYPGLLRAGARPASLGGDSGAGRRFFFFG